MAKAKEVHGFAGGPIPFDPEGNLMHYPGDTYRYTHGKYTPFKPKWMAPFEFDDTMEIDVIRTGRSAKYVLWASTTTGKTYPMFIREIVELINKAQILQGKVTGCWAFAKRGQNYGVKWVANAE